VVELAQVENMIVHIGDLVLEAAMHGAAPARWGNRSPDFAPQGVYRCAGNDQWLALSVRDDADWSALRAVLGDPPQLNEPAYATVGGRHAAHDQIDTQIESWTLRHDKLDAFHALQAAGVPAGAVMDEADASSDPQLQARGFFQLLEHLSAGTHRHPGANFQLRATPSQRWRAAPVLGQDNDYVYREVLGIDEPTYAALVAAGHIGTAYV
jgi:crotonobetainyl-CoA:carnitine CoA-transferase CaiB-like acyl-CoA transferase